MLCKNLSQRAIRVAGTMREKPSQRIYNRCYSSTPHQKPLPDVMVEDLNGSPSIMNVMDPQIEVKQNLPPQPRPELQRKTMMLRELLSQKPIHNDTASLPSYPYPNGSNGYSTNGSNGHYNGANGHANGSNGSNGHHTGSNGHVANGSIGHNSTARRTEFIMEAHNGLSAKIVQQAGFKGIWASGLSISAALGVRDNNEASWTQVLEVLEFMSDNTDIPILLDGDTGYGNFNNARRLVRKLEQRNIAGVCIEDKIFPKTNSFLGDCQPLADLDEFCGKIKAMKDQQNDPYFNVVARVEAFISGYGLGEALKRAEAYRRAGADAILMHSKRADSLEIDQFMKEWANRHPVVIVPTKYYAVPTKHFSDIGVNMIIWANHNLRASINAMQNVCNQIYQDQSLINVEKKVASVNEIFRLQNAGELEEAEERYLPKTSKLQELMSQQ